MTSTDIQRRRPPFASLRTYVACLCEPFRALYADEWATLLRGAHIVRSTIRLGASLKQSERSNTYGMSPVPLTETIDHCDNWLRLFVSSSWAPSMTVSVAEG